MHIRTFLLTCCIAANVPVILVNVTQDPFANANPFEFKSSASGSELFNGAAADNDPFAYDFNEQVMLTCACVFAFVYACAYV